MRLSISSQDGRVCAMDVEPSQMLEDVCALIEVEFGILISQQLLMHNGKNINSGDGALRKTLSQLGITSDDLIMVSKVATAPPKAARRVRGGTVSKTQYRPSEYTLSILVQCLRAELNGVVTIDVSTTSSSTQRQDNQMFAGSITAPAAKRAHIDPEVYSSLTWEDITADVPPDVLHAILQVNSGMMTLIERRDPEMYAAARQAQPAELRKLLLKRSMDRALPEAARAARHAQLEARLAADPFDVEAQRELESMIAQKNIEENLEMAMEHLPESFVKVTMLYVDAKINGVPVKVFVDSGAQSTILSKNCAERCGIMRLVDEKFAGRAIGVGSARIIGRVHMAGLTLGEHHFNCTFTVLDQNDVDCLLGLDMLKRFQCCIDLFHNVLKLRLGGEEVAVPFLGEADVPRGAFHAGADPADLPNSGAGTAPATTGASATPTTATATATPPVSSNPLMAPLKLSGVSASASSTVQNTSTAPAPAPKTSAYPEESVNFLMGMGFPREKCLRALELTGGRVDEAVDLLPDL